jgi:hypothetical protein
MKLLTILQENLVLFSVVVEQHNIVVVPPPEAVLDKGLHGT